MTAEGKPGEYEEWVEHCLECKHAYRRQDDTETLWCRLRKKKCPYMEEVKEK